MNERINLRKSNKIKVVQKNVNKNIGDQRNDLRYADFPFFSKLNNN